MRAVHAFVLAAIIVVLVVVFRDAGPMHEASPQAQELRPQVSDKNGSKAGQFLPPDQASETQDIREVEEELTFTDFLCAVDDDLRRHSSEEELFLEGWKLLHGLLSKPASLEELLQVIEDAFCGAFEGLNSDNERVVTRLATRASAEIRGRVRDAEAALALITYLEETNCPLMQVISVDALGGHDELQEDLLWSLHEWSNRRAPVGERDELLLRLTILRTAPLTDRYYLNASRCFDAQLREIDLLEAFESARTVCAREARSRRVEIVVPQQVRDSSSTFCQKVLDWGSSGLTESERSAAARFSIYLSSDTVLAFLGLESESGGEVRLEEQLVEYWANSSGR